MMRHTRHRLWRFRFLIGFALALSVLLFCHFAVLRIPRWRLERAIGRFEAAPSQAAADELMAYLGNGTATVEQGARVLRLLLEPKITTRKAYPAGQPAGISTEHLFRLNCSGARIQLDCAIEGEQVPQGYRPDHGMNALATVPRIFIVHPSAQAPATHRFCLSYDCRVAIQRRHSPLWQKIRAFVLRFLGSSPSGRLQETTYRCRFTVPVEIDIARDEAAEHLEVICGNPIDETMRKIVTVQGRSDSHGAYETPSGRHGYRGSRLIEFQTLPVGVAWRVSLRLADGWELPENPAEQAQRIRARAGVYGAYVIDVGRFGFEEPGEYAGTLILRPDPNYAYEDPAIKSLWNGTLEFPVSFVVYDKGPRR